MPTFQPSNPPTLAIIGQISPWKGHADALRALALVSRRYPDARLLIVGGLKFAQATARYDNAAYLTELHALVDALDLAGRVIFTGERSDIPAIMSICDAVLVPSWEEPFGRTVVEAMAMARPVVATSVGGPAEIVEHGVTGLLVPPRDPEALATAILHLLDDPDASHHIALRARQAALERFSAHTHTATLLHLYAEILGHAAIPLSPSSSPSPLVGEGARG